MSGRKHFASLLLQVRRRQRTNEVVLQSFSPDGHNLYAHVDTDNLLSVLGTALEYEYANLKKSLQASFCS